MHMTVIIICVLALILLILLGLSIVNNSTADLLDTYKKTSNTVTGDTPVQFAEFINNNYFNGSIKIKYSDKLFDDSFSGSNVLTLCSKYANSNNIASLSICAHELGHAFQFKENKQKMNKHAKNLKFSNIISKFALPFVILALVIACFGYAYVALAVGALGFFCFFSAIISKIATLKIEKEATNKALQLLQTHAMFTDQELKIAKTFLASAKQTYVASILKSMLKWTMFVNK